VPVIQAVEVDDADGADGDVAKAKERGACSGSDGCQSVSPFKKIFWNWMVGFSPGVKGYISPGCKEIGEHATVRHSSLVNAVQVNTEEIRHL